MVRAPEPGGSGFRVQPGELDGAGKTAKATAELIPGETKGVLGASDKAEAGLKGWTTGAELNSCTDSWRALLDSLSAEMDRQGENLVKTAKNYRDSDEKAHGDISGIGTGSGGPEFAAGGGGGAAGDKLSTMSAFADNGMARGGAETGSTRPTLGEPPWAHPFPSPRDGDVPWQRPPITGDPDPGFHAPPGIGGSSTELPVPGPAERARIDAERFGPNAQSPQGI
ncbi:hypothetical protein [Streptomyces sp. CB03911]|uniref:hypothetical protein n=1 Tax=Streptomycetaceae TaxID=2062 RepID=UPI0018FEECE3|nr:hypothetical protein [Streptomyces sp. CB03911]